MADNSNNNGAQNAQWWSKVTLKEWSIIVGAIGFFYLTIVGGVESLKSSVTEIKATLKEDRLENRVILDKIRLDLDKVKTEVEILKIKVESNERKVDN